MSFGLNIYMCFFNVFIKKCAVFYNLCYICCIICNIYIYIYKMFEIEENIVLQLFIYGISYFKG